MPIECTFFRNCVNAILINVCLNCGGGFEKRPIIPKDELIQNTAIKNIFSNLFRKIIFLRKIEILNPGIGNSLN